MKTYEMVEYRPGRWAKIDASTGRFLGPAQPEEVHAWQNQIDTSPGLPRLPEGAEWRLSGDTLSGAQPGPLAFNVQPPAPGEGAPPTQPQQPVVWTALDEPGPQEPAPEPVTDPAPQPPVPEKEPADPAPQQPDGGEPAPTPAPPQPAPEKKAAPQKPTPKPSKAEEAGTGYPLAKRYRISSNFRAHQTRKPPSTAPGIDLACPRGTEVRAWAKGNVLRSRWSDGGGRSLWLQHEGGVKTYYAHLNAAFVLEGEIVSAGQKIGESGNTGRTTGPHLHFSVVKGGKYVDPEKFVKT